MSALPRSGCPDPELLLASGRGDLPAPQSRAISTHLGHCAGCRAWLTAALQSAEPDPLRRGRQESDGPGGSIDRTRDFRRPEDDVPTVSPPAHTPAVLPAGGAGPDGA